jgi:GAF domain-containing protein
VLRVPSAALSVLEFAVAAQGIPTIGYFAQVPHYVTGPYPPAAVELLRLVGLHAGVELAASELRDEAQLVLTRLDAATAAEATTRAYVERLEAMVDEARRPAGTDLISEIEQFLREQGRGRDRS